MSKSEMKPVQILRAGQIAEVYIFGDIVASQWFEDETSADSFRREVQNLAAEGVSQINVHIDSYGGAVSAGWAIYNVLKDFAGSVDTYADGFVASAAVYPFLAGRNRYANPMSAFFLHQAWTSAGGNADELRKAADEIEKFNAIGLEAFAAAGMDKEKILELEKDETWLTASEALELGLATEIVDRSEERAAQQSVRGMVLKAVTEQSRQRREKDKEKSEQAQRDLTPEEPEDRGEDKTNNLMAFLTKAQRTKE